MASIFRYVRGPLQLKWMNKVASAAMTAGEFAAFTAAGYLAKATSTSTEIQGLLARTVTSADDDYASTNQVPVLAGDETTIWNSSGEAHGCTQAMVGEFVDITDSNTINGGANSLEVIKVERYISATEIEFSIPKKSGVAASTNAD